MSGCCSDDNKSESSCCSDSDTSKKEENKITGQEIPKSFVGRYLYNMGKKDIEKNKGKSKGGGCC